MTGHETIIQIELNDGTWKDDMTIVGECTPERFLEMLNASKTNAVTEYPATSANRVRTILVIDLWEPAK